MRSSHVVYAAIPDSCVLIAQELAEAACGSRGGTCDWEFHDSYRVVYWFTDSAACKLFEAECALNGWASVSA